MSSSSSRLVESALDLAWSLWTELGVPGTIRRHEDFAVDVEPLLLFTPRLVDRDPRLRDESIAWVRRNHRFVSRARLRRLLKLESPEARSSFGPYAGTLALHTPGVWPGAGEGWPIELPARTSARRPFNEPSLIRLRLRALLGVGARAEIALAFISGPSVALTASDLADLSGFTKSNIKQELDAFTLAGLLVASSAANRLVYRLAEPDRLLRFAGDLPAVFVNWAATLRLTGEVLDVALRGEDLPETVVAVEVARLLESRAAEWAGAEFPPRPPSAVGEDLVRWFFSTTEHSLDALAHGRVIVRA